MNSDPVYVLDDLDDGPCLVASGNLQSVMDYAGHAAIQWQYAGIRGLACIESERP